MQQLVWGCQLPSIMRMHIIREAWLLYGEVRTLQFCCWELRVRQGISKGDSSLTKQETALYVFITNTEGFLLQTIETSKKKRD